MTMKECREELQAFNLQAFKRKYSAAGWKGYHLGEEIMRGEGYAERHIKARENNCRSRGKQQKPQYRQGNERAC